MSRSKKIVMSICVIAVVLAIAFCMIIIYEPTGYTRAVVLGEALHRGKITREWRKVLLADGEAGHVSDETIDAFKGTTAVEVLTECTADTDRNVRWPAIVLLRECFFRGYSANRILPALKVALGDKDPEVRNQAALTLGAMKSDGRTAFFELAKLQNDPEDQIQLTSNRALWSIHAEKARDVSGWKKVDHLQHGFEAEFPHEPDITNITREHDGHSFDVHAYRARQWKITNCMVIICNYDSFALTELLKKQFEERLDEFLGTFLEAKLISENAIVQFDRSGVEKTLEYRKMFIIQRTFWVGSRLYVAAIVTNPEFANSMADTYFLDSLRIR